VGQFPHTKFLCAGFDEEGLCYSGGANGLIYCWDQRGELGLTLKAHAGECTAITAFQGRLISAGRDHEITVHSIIKGQFEYLHSIKHPVAAAATSLDFLDGKILVGHENGRIAVSDIQGNDYDIISTGHHSGEVWGLAMVKQQNCFLTCGDDNEFHEVSIADKRVIRSGKVWTALDFNKGKPYQTNKMKSTASTNSQYPPHQQARAIAFSEGHNQVAVSNNYGDVTIFDYSDFTEPVQTLYDPDEWCEAMQYSPNDKYLAAGSHDNSIYVYLVEGQSRYELHWRIKDTFSSAITALDWSLDSQYIRGTDQAYDKDFFDVVRKEEALEGNRTLTDVGRWNTLSCKLGWEVMGVFQAGTDGTDVNHVDVAPARNLIAVADDFGSVNFYRFPCLKNSQDCVRMTGHSEHVTRVKFWADKAGNKGIITAGGNDKTYI